LYCISQTEEKESLPIKVPRKNGSRGTFITGEAMLMNQLGKNGVIRRNIM
jgi:hypothetical protein